MRVRVSIGVAVIVTTVVCLATPAAAARYHVHVGGTRAGGPSVPGDWTFDNCYGTLGGALEAASPADSVLLYEETHALSAPATLRSLLANRSLQASPTGAGIALGPAGTLAVDPSLVTTAIVGLDVTGAAGPRVVAAVSLTNPAGTVTTVVVKGCSFSGLLGATQDGAGGSAIRATSPGTTATLVIDDCTFTGNQTQGSGGAVWIGGGYNVTMTECVFTSNRTTGGGHGGAVMVAATSAPSSLVLEDCEFTDNRAAGPGGCLNLDSASLVMRRCVVQASQSAAEDGAFFKEGAGLRVARSGGHTEPVEILIEACEFRDNHGSISANNNAGDGGAILVKGGDVTRMIWVEVDDCLFRDNSNAQGAGIYVGRFCQGEVRYSRFIDNIAWYQGGGAFKGGELPECEGELLTLAYCEFRGNRAGYKPDGSETGEYSRGGGLGVRNHPRVHAYNCTFVDNRVNNATYAIGDGFAHALEGGVWTTVNRCSLVNCAFWGEGGDLQVRCEGSGGMELVSHVAVRSGQMSVPGATPVGTVWLTEFPFVAPLDLHPAGGSPLIDGGVVVAYTADLDGLSVPYGSGFDIGCYEIHDMVGIESPPPPQGTRLSVNPNPFNPRTSLTFTTAETGQVRVAIHDPRGRLVRQLWAGELPSGAHALAWDGRDDGGRGVSTGVYLACLQFNGRESGQVKLSLVR